MPARRPRLLFLAFFAVRVALARVFFLLACRGVGFEFLSGRVLTRYSIRARYSTLDGLSPAAGTNVMSFSPSIVSTC